MKKPVIAVDFDDVIADFNRAFLTFHNRTYCSTVAYEDICAFDAYTVFGVERTEFHRRLLEFCNTQQHTAEPIDGANTALQALSKDYELHVVTSRCDSLQMVTKTWLRSWLPGVFSALHFTNGAAGLYPERHRSKSTVCKEIAARVLIEDALHNAAAVSTQGIPVLLPDRPWNQDPLPKGTWRMDTWNEITDWIYSHLKK